MTNILGIAGSRRLNTYSTRALKLVLEKAATKYDQKQIWLIWAKWNYQYIIQKRQNPDVCHKRGHKGWFICVSIPRLSWLYVRSNEEFVGLLLEGVRRKDIWIHRGIAWKGVDSNGSNEDCGTSMLRLEHALWDIYSRGPRFRWVAILKIVHYLPD